MIFTKKQIKEIRKAWARADKAEQAAQAAAQRIGSVGADAGLLAFIFSNFFYGKAAN